MGDACASKLLHQMVPTLFVMWDSKIKFGFGTTYGSFMLDTHRFALRLRHQLAPMEARTDIEGSSLCVPTWHYASPVRGGRSRHVEAEAKAGNHVRDR
jgi:hypothetical protein